MRAPVQEMGRGSEYAAIPALNASAIKKHYTGGDVSEFALFKGSEFHKQLLETSPDDMAPDAKNAYKAIMLHPVLSYIFTDGFKEMTVTGVVEVNGVRVRAKGIVDIFHRSGVIVDIKGTQCKTQIDFAKEMREHYNHVQAWWYCKMMGLKFKNFYFLGINPDVKKPYSSPLDLLIYSFSDEHMVEAESLVKDFVYEHGRHYLID